MKKYLSLLKEVKKHGIIKKDRTNVGTICIFGTQNRYPLSYEAFPIITTKKVNWKAMVHELLWFISGSTNIQYLVQNNVNIWNEWPYKKFQNSPKYNNETIKEYAQKIREDDDFAKLHGELGPVYGKQWRDFDGIDQLSNVIEDLKNNPSSRRIILSAWNPKEIKSMLLPPCHAFVQFDVIDNKLYCQLYQRSADVFLGVPFNISSYSLLTMMIAKTLGFDLGDFVHPTGDTHIYLNHLNQVDTQLKRKPKKLPEIKLNENVKSIFDFTIDDIELIEYDSWPFIKAKVAV